MNISIVGSGKVGSALGAWLAQAGYAVIFSARDQAHADAAAKHSRCGAVAMETASAVQRSDIVLLALPFTEISAALNPVREHLTGKILVDVTNPITSDHRALSIGHTHSGAEEIAQWFPTANVVKAFNAVFAEVYASQHAQIDGRAITIFYAGDDPQSKASVHTIIAALGFDPVDAGPLENARYLEPLSLLNIHLGRVLGFGMQIGFSLLR